MYFESNPLSFIAIAVIAAGILLIESLINQLVIETRNKISYINFKDKKQLFNLKPSAIRLLLYGIVLAYSLPILVIASLSNITRIYLFVLIPVVVLIALLFVFELTVRKKNKDLKIFDNEYNKIISAINSKEKANEEYNELSLMLTSFTQKWEETALRIEAYTGKKLTLNSQAISAAEASLRKLVSEINNFDDECLKKFDDKLHSYINQECSDAQIDLNSIIVPSKDSFIAFINQAEAEYKKAVYELTKESIDKKTISNADDLNRLIAENISLNNNVKDLLWNILTLIENLAHREDSVKYLFDTQILTENDTIECVQRRVLCIFDLDIYTFVSSKKYCELLQKIIENDDTELAMPILKRIKLERVQIVKGILKTCGYDNSCTSLMKTYLDVFSVKYGFGDTSNSYENMAFSLLNYYKRGTKENGAIQKIIDEESFLKNKQIIRDWYGLAASEVEELKTPFIKCLIAYRDCWCSNKPIFDFIKIIDLFKESGTSINIVKIKKIICLISSVVLVEETDKELVIEALEAIKSTGCIGEYYKGKTSTKSAATIGKTILSKMLSEETKTILPILYRIESERLSFERLLKM